MGREDSMNVFHILLFDWWKNKRRSFPWRGEGISSYRLLVTEMLLWKTRAETVEAIWNRFFDRFPDVHSLSEATEDEINEIIVSLGLSKRAACLKEMAVRIVDEYGGVVPSNKDDLLSLMGIGEYAASATMCFAFGEDVPIIDANVKRILMRVFGCDEDELIAISDALVPQDAGPEWGYALLDLGAFLCKYKPICKECPLRTVCVTGKNS